MLIKPRLLWPVLSDFRIRKSWFLLLSQDFAYHIWGGQRKNKSVSNIKRRIFSSELSIPRNFWPLIMVSTTPGSSGSAGLPSESSWEHTPLMLWGRRWPQSCLGCIWHSSTAPTRRGPVVLTGWVVDSRTESRAIAGQNGPVRADTPAAPVGGPS